MGPYSLEFSNDARTAMIAVAELLLMVDVLSNVAIILKLLLCDVQVVVDCVVAKVKAMTEVFELMVPHQLAWLESHLSPPPPAPPIMIHPLSSLLTELYPHCRCDSPVRVPILPILNTYMAPEHLHPSIHDVTQQRLSFSINTSSTISSRTTRPSSPRDERRWSLSYLPTLLSLTLQRLESHIMKKHRDVDLLVRCARGHCLTSRFLVLRRLYSRVLAKCQIDLRTCVLISAHRKKRQATLP